MTKPPAISDLWMHLSESLFAKIDDDFIASFRAPGGANHRLAGWEPFDKTMRYFKLLLFNVARHEPDRFFELYRALGQVGLGNPVSVFVRSCGINIDYLLSVEEFLFVERAIEVARLRSVVEIGAGFGRTCHAFVNLAPSIERYTILDLRNVLALSRRYLAMTIPEQFHKIRFVEVGAGGAPQSLEADLAINIDSFQEMPPATINGYMTSVVANCSYAYIKNPVAKYHPKTVGIAVDDPHKFHDVFALGHCRDVIDIFDELALQEARKKYLAAYRPGPTWRLGADEPLTIFPHYHHALYIRDGGA